MGHSAHLDTFVLDRLPPPAQQPAFLFDLPALRFPSQLNCAVELLERHVERGFGDRLCLQAVGVRWTYAEFKCKVDRVAHVLVSEMGLVPGNRVLLRAANNPMLAACWFAVVKAGGIAVATMPLLRAKELTHILEKAQVSHALCDLPLAAELDQARRRCPGLREVRYFHDSSPAGLEALMARHDTLFPAADTAATDPCIVAFTSGTTGQPKATVHFHRDLMAICACWPPHVLKAGADDVFLGSPPLAFTFGLGGSLLFPMSIGASSVLLEKAGPPQLLDAIREFGVTVLFTAPTSYRAMAAEAARRKVGAPQGGRLRKCVSAGEVLPAATRALWKESTGIEMIDGIGSTEMLHIFISADESCARAGATGLAIPGYQACVMDDAGNVLPPGRVGRLAVKGPTGCRYLDDPRQAQYVKDGWNYTGDAYLLDEDGYFHYQSRVDDMIISAGYNIAAPEVEEVLLQHPVVAECAVIGVPDEERGQIVKAFVVLREGSVQSATLAREIQEFVKQSIAPYKYPRAVEFCPALPRTETGKLQRYRLRDLPAQACSARDSSNNNSEEMLMKVLLPGGWPRPKGYSNGVAATGHMVFVAGMIGWDTRGEIQSEDMAGQARQALANVVAVLQEGGARPEHIVRMTWYVTDKREYLARQKEIGAAYREIIGSYNAAMTAVEVSALIEDRAKIEIEATAVIPQ